MPLVSVTAIMKSPSVQNGFGNGFGFLETSLNCKLGFYSRAPGFCFSFEYLIGYIMVKKIE